MGGADVDRSSGSGVNPTAIAMAAWEDQFVHAVAILDREPEVAIVRDGVHVGDRLPHR
jgi:hypothetical protein